MAAAGNGTNGAAPAARAETVSSVSSVAEVGGGAAVASDQPAEKAPESASLAFPIVGIGASAGGLAAFEAFFSALPTDAEPGMAFVLVQHLAPDHKSLLSELVRRYTRMQVFDVEDGMKVQPNCAYIIQPNFDMAFAGGVLRLLPPAAARGQRLPIDFLFRSLADDQHERAICIVLSGTGTDGTLGVRAIKGAGGMAMAQNLESTEFGGMPQSAIATGLVDYVLPPAEMPVHLIAYAASAWPIRPATLAPTGKQDDAIKNSMVARKPPSALRMRSRVQPGAMAGAPAWSVSPSSLPTKEMWPMGNSHSAVAR